MNRFSYGDDHPLIDAKNRRRDARIRAARKSLEYLLKAESLYLRGGDGIHEGLALFDREAINIRYWQK